MQTSAASFCRSKHFIFVCLGIWLGLLGMTTREAQAVRKCFCHNLSNNPDELCTSEQAIQEGHARHIARGTDSAGKCNHCGDGILDPGEECDDGNNHCGDGCDEDCNSEELGKCDDGNICTTDSCNDTSGECLHEPVPDETSCDDGIRCTEADLCLSGACIGNLAEPAGMRR